MASPDDEVTYTREQVEQLGEDDLLLAYRWLSENNIEIGETVTLHEFKQLLLNRLTPAESIAVSTFSDFVSSLIGSKDVAYGGTSF